MNKIPFIPLILLCIAFKGNSDFKRSGYIRMQFQGVSDKPHTTAIFYLNGSVDATFEDFVQKFEVSEYEFDSIKEIISQADFNTISDPIPDVFEFAILEDQKMKYYPTRFSGTLKEILKNVILHSRKTKYKEEVEITLTSIMSRLGIKL